MNWEHSIPTQAVMKQWPSWVANNGGHHSLSSVRSGTEVKTFCLWIVESTIVSFFIKLDSQDKNLRLVASQRDETIRAEFIMDIS